MKKIKILIALLLSTALLIIGCKANSSSSTTGETTKISLTGTFQYHNGNAITRTINDIATDYTVNFTTDLPVDIGTGVVAPVYTISPDLHSTASKISFDTSTGKISVAQDAPALSATTYTITLTAHADDTKYTGSIQTTVSIAIQAAAKKTLTGTFQYHNGNAITRTYDDAAADYTVNFTTDLPVDIGKGAVAPAYTISPDPNSATSKINFDTSTGKISIAQDAPALSATPYTITLTAHADDTKYTGSIQTTVSIAIQAAAKKILTGIFQYHSGNAITRTINDTATDYTVNFTTDLPVDIGKGAVAPAYTISPVPNSATSKINFDTSTGKISIAQDAPALSATPYTITLTAHADDTKYTGSIQTTVSITINKIAVTGTFQYHNGNAIIRTYRDSATDYAVNFTTDLPVDIGTGATAPAYTISPDPNSTASKISFDTSTGKISVAQDAPALSATPYTITLTAHADDTKYTGSIQTTVTITINKKAISATVFQYHNGNAITRTVNGTATDYGPSVAPNLPADIGTGAAAPVYTISPDPNSTTSKISLDPSTGTLSIAQDAPALSTTTYFIRLTAHTDDTNYTGHIQASVSITINKIAISATVFQYHNGNAITRTVNGTATDYGPSVAPNLPADIGTGAAAPVYTISPDPNSTTSKISLDPSTGTLSIAQDAPALSTTTYFIRLTAHTDDTNYTGHIQASVSITINKIAITGLSYNTNNAVSVASNKTETFSPVLTPAGATATFAIDTPVTGVSIADGILSIIGSTTDLDGKTVSITATGSGNYDGTMQTTVTITVTAPVKIDIANLAFVYTARTSTYENSSSSRGVSPSSDEIGNDADYSAVNPLPTGFTLNGNSIIYKKNTKPGSYTFTIRATAKAGSTTHTGTKEATATLTINKGTSLVHAWAYSAIPDIIRPFTDAQTIAPSVNALDTNATVIYSISPTVAGITVDNVAVISIAASTNPIDQRFTVTATASQDNEYYSNTATRTTNVDIVVRNAYVSDYTIVYPETTVARSGSETIFPTITLNGVAATIPSEANYEYSQATSSDQNNFNASIEDFSTGAIELRAWVSGTYTVTVTMRVFNPDYYDRSSFITLPAFTVNVP